MTSCLIRRLVGAFTLFLVHPVAAAELPPGPLSPADLRSVAARDGLIVEGDAELHNVGARWLSSQRAAEFDGRPPREIVLEVTEYTGEGTWQTEYRAYRRGDPLPTPLGPPVVTGGYRDPGYLTVQDLDGDGRDELVVVGDTDGGGPSTLDIWRLQGDRWAQQVWGPDLGLDYVVVDHWLDPGAIPRTDDRPIIALRPAEDGLIAEPWIPIGGLYHPWPVDHRPLLAPLMAHLAAHPPTRPGHVFPRLAVALAEAGVVPPDGTLRDLRRQHAQVEESWGHAALLAAMAWPGNAGAAPHLRRMLEPPGADAVVAAAAEALVAVGTEVDRVALLDWSIAEGTPRVVAQAIVRAFAGRGDPRARARLAKALHAPTRPTSERAELVDLLASDPASIPDLARALDAAGAPREAIADALWTRALYSPEHPAWHLPVVADAARRLLNDANPAISKDAVLVVQVADPRAEETLRAAATRVEPQQRMAILAALDKLDADEGVSRLVARTAADALRGAPFDNETVARHRLVARYGDDAARAIGLAALDPAQLDTPSLLERYARGLSERPPRDADVIERMAVSLQGMLGDGRSDGARRAAVQALGALDSERARATLTLQMRTDPAASVRADAAEALGRRHPDVEEALIVRLMREAEETVRSDLIAALGKHGTPRARATLIDRLGHPRDGWAAAHALARVPDAAGLEVGAVLAQHARALLDGEDGCAAVRRPLAALARGGLAAASAVLRDAIEACPDARAELVAAAIDGWHREGSPESRGHVLTHAAASDRDIARAAWHALQNWP